MKRIPLTQGKFALVDDEDFEYLNQWKWLCEKGRYAARNSLKGECIVHKIIYMHRTIMRDPYKYLNSCIDHINGDGLDNRKENLRWASQAENVRNRSIGSNNTSGYKGVVLYKGVKNLQNPWRAFINIDKNKVNLGYFKTAEDAAKAYNIKAKELFGQFARLNDIGA